MGLFDKKVRLGSRRGQYLKNVGVLVVDDLEDHRELYREILIDDGYTNIHTARNGTECLSILQSMGDEIFVVLLDRKLPDTTAEDIVRHLLKVHRHVVGIVINTGFPSTESRYGLSDMGSEIVHLTAYLEKSNFDIDTISAEIRKTAELIHGKRAEIAAQKVEAAHESLQGIRLELSRVESQFRSGVSHISGKIPGFATLNALGVIRALMLALFIGVALKVDVVSDITAFFARFID